MLAAAEPALGIIAAMLADEPVEAAPRNVSQDLLKYGGLVAPDIGPRGGKRRRALSRIRTNVMRSYTHKPCRTAVAKAEYLRPPFAAPKGWILAPSASMTVKEDGPL